MPKKPTTLRFEPEEREALERVRVKLGISNWAETIRYLISKEDKQN